MPKYQVVLATRQHAEQVAAGLADEDARELASCGYSDALAGILDSMAKSTAPLAWLADGQPMCVYGVVPVMLLPPVGSPWMLAHRELPCHRRAFLTESKRWTASQQVIHSLLVNYVGSWHTRSIHWLKWLGFTLGPVGPVPFATGDWHKVWWVRR